MPKLARLFYVGQLLPCCVLEADKKNVVLSVNPKLVNARLTASDLHVNMVSGWAVLRGGRGHSGQHGVY